MPIEWLPNPEPGTHIVLAFDGSETDDFSVIRAETKDGFQFTPRYGDDRDPTIWNPDEWNGQIPRGEVDAAVDELFSTYKVSRFYCDPSGWYSEIGDWAVRFGQDKVFEWSNGRIDRMFHAIRRFEVDLSTGRIRNDGCPITSVHIANARKVSKPGQKYVLGKPTNHQKIDAAMASIVAHEAAMDMNEAGWPDLTPVSSKMICF